VLSEYFRNIEVRCEKNRDTKTLSSLKAGGVAALVVYPEDAKGFVKTIRICNKNGLRYTVIGNCTNTAFADSGFDGVIISTSKLKGAKSFEGGIRVECGVSLPYLIKHFSRLGVGLPPELSGIPGSVGGAIRNNAGAYGKSISDIFILGVFYSPTEDKLITLTNDEMNFGYRYSVLAEKKLYLIEAKLSTFTCDAESQAKDIAELAAKRRISQPHEPSLGSFFKRCDGVSAGRLIDMAGLKGFSVGGAAVSEKHAGFIINKGDAAVSDVLSVANACERSVFEKFGIVLTREAEIIYNK